MNTMSRKGFTFAQMATLILVILGLTVGVILASTQLGASAGSISELGSQATSGTQAAVTASAGLACRTIGGVQCADACDVYLNVGGSTTTDLANADSGLDIGCQDSGAIYCCKEAATGASLLPTGATCADDAECESGTCQLDNTCA